MPFPTTHWSLLDATRADDASGARAQAIATLVSCYWHPVYVHLRRRGHAHQDAEDLAQSFFETVLLKALFARADRSRGRFRSFLLTALDNFTRNDERGRRAARRRPEGGIAPLDETIATTDDDPERAFFRTYAQHTLTRLLTELEARSRENGQTVHYQVFRRRIVEPALDGVVPPSEAALAGELGVREKQVANYLVTMKRAFRRLLVEHVERYAANEADVAAEIGELMGSFAFPE